MVKKLSLLTATLILAFGMSFTSYAKTATSSSAAYEDSSSQKAESIKEPLSNKNEIPKASTSSANKVKAPKRLKAELLIEEDDNKLNWYDFVKLQEKLCADMPDSVDYSVIYSEETAIEFYEQYFTPEIQREYRITLSTGSFVEPRIYKTKDNGAEFKYGSAHILIYTDGIVTPIFDTIHITVGDPVIQAYTDIVTKLDEQSTKFDRLSAIQLYGVTTESQIIERISEFIPNYDGIGYEFSVSRFVTMPGSTLQTDYCGIRMTIWNNENPYAKIDCGNICYVKINSTSSNSNSSDGGNTHTPTGLEICKDNIDSGIWESVGQKWKLKLPDGTYAASRWAFLNDKWYLFGTDKYMMTGWQQVDGKWYYLNPMGDMASGWLEDHGLWYWLEQSGEMVKGWKQINNLWYYFGADGAMWCNKTTPDGYYVGHDGAWLQ